MWRLNLNRDKGQRFLAWWGTSSFLIEIFAPASLFTRYIVWLNASCLLYTWPSPMGPGQWQMLVLCVGFGSKKSKSTHNCHQTMVLEIGSSMGIGRTRGARGGTGISAEKRCGELCWFALSSMHAKFHSPEFTNHRKVFDRSTYTFSKHVTWVSRLGMWRVKEGMLNHVRIMEWFVWSWILDWWWCQCSVVVGVALGGPRWYRSNAVGDWCWLGEWVGCWGWVGLKKKMGMRGLLGMMMVWVILKQIWQQNLVRFWTNQSIRDNPLQKSPPRPLHGCNPWSPPYHHYKGCVA